MEETRFFNEFFKTEFVVIIFFMDSRMVIYHNIFIYRYLRSKYA